MAKIIYWRRELPPLSEQVEGEHEVEADSAAIAQEVGGRQQLWGRCYPALLEVAEQRMAQEVRRLGGSCAHVVDEVITARVDDAAGTFALHGRFRYVLYVHPAG
jgi:hypothetical protein